METRASIMVAVCSASETVCGESAADIEVEYVWGCNGQITIVRVGATPSHLTLYTSHGRSPMHVYSNALEMIGHTPMIQFNRFDTGAVNCF